LGQLGISAAEMAETSSASFRSAIAVRPNIMLAAMKYQRKNQGAIRN
jgi:hypothetical protein